MIVEDDRTAAQKKSHTWLVIGTDSFLSGRGCTTGGKSYAVWACKPINADQIFAWVNNRSDMTRVREHDETTSTYWPRGSIHCHIYVVNETHPALNT